MALIAGLERQLEAIDPALQRAQLGTYGICERCGQPTDPARLAIVPETTYCVACKLLTEQATRSKTRISRY